MRSRIFTLICLLAVIPCQARTITVDDDGPADFNNVQAAIDESNAGDIIEIQPGMYTGSGNRDIDFGGKAITVRSSNPDDQNVVAATVIDCNGTEGEPHRGFCFHGDEGADSVLEGLTIINGWDSVGAGITCDGASPTIRHCLISGNTSRSHGGGLYCRFSSPVTTNCILRDNTAIDGHGGGIFCLGSGLDISACIISDNSAGGSGGGLFNNNSSPVLLNCDFIDNSAGDYGGGLCSVNNSIPIMTDCMFSDNRADYCGDDTYLEGEQCIELNKSAAGAKVYNIMSSGGSSDEYQMSGSSGTVYYVNGLCGNDSWSGLDPCCTGPDGPKQTIQAAIDDADNNDTIIVFPHIYFENIEMEGNDISLTSIDPKDPNVVETTVIDGGGWNSVVTFAGTEGPNCLLAGFTITRGFAYFPVGGSGITGNNTYATISKCTIEGNGNKYEQGLGSGIAKCHGVITNCDIIGNRAESACGVGLYDCDGLIINCNISGNIMGQIGDGGGLGGCDGVILNCTITGNYSGWDSYERGGGLAYCNAAIVDCIISNNYATDQGGGLYLCGGPIINCIIADNELEGRRPDSGGAGLYGCNGDISNCIIIDNVAGANPYLMASGAGGGLNSCNGKITNCLIARNIASAAPDAWLDPGYGGGLYNCNGEITNCTVVNNISPTEGGGLAKCTAIITNSIVWGNSSPNNPQLYLSSNPDYSCIQDWAGGGFGNILDDPCFVDPNIDDYHLKPDSPCINAGDPNYPIDPNETDIDGHPRVIGGRIDMGADEVVIATMRFTPPVLHPFSRGKWIKAHMVLPEGFDVGDVDENRPALLEPFGIESHHINVFVNEDGLVEIEAAFVRAALCEAGVNDEATGVRVIGSFTNGEYFYGTDTIRIFNGGLKYVAVLATHWLEVGCGAPDWCGGADLDRSSTVDFADFALFDGCCIEAVDE